MSTLPIELDLLVSALLHHLPGEAELEASKVGSPLFPTLVIANLQQIQEDLRATRLTPAEKATAARLPIEPRVLDALDRERMTCRVTDSAFYTPQVLLALLSLHSITWTCFNRTAPGLANRVQRELQHYVQTRRQPYVAFDWRDRLELQIAQSLSFSDGRESVAESYVLSGVLKAPSQTKQQLQQQLKGSFRVLCSLAAETRGRTAVSATPGPIFGRPLL